MSDKKKIMVVDDDSDIIDSMSIILESSGYKVISGTSVEECQEILLHEKPDLIILDIMMETMVDGFNIAQDLKASPEYSDIPIIMVSLIAQNTGFSFDKELLQADEFLEKPFEPGFLLACIEKHLKKKPTNPEK